MRASVKPAVERLNKWAGPFMIVLALALGASYAVSLHQSQQAEACQAEYNRVFAIQVAERSRLSTESDNSKTDLLQAMGSAFLTTPSKDSEVEKKRVDAFLNLFREYNKTVERIEQLRIETPLPDFPTC